MRCSRSIAITSASVAVLWGAGGAFCAGFDLKYAASQLGQKDPMAPLNFPDGEGPVPRGPMGPTRLQLSKPVIAAVAGPAVAGGMELALWCDLRVMEESAYMGVYCRRWGVPLIDGGTVRLPRIVGRGTALDLILTGRKVAADECLPHRPVPSASCRTARAAPPPKRWRMRSRAFPQACMRADRRSVFLQEGLSEMDGLALRMGLLVRAWSSVRVRPAPRAFSSGKGRHGDFGSI